MYDSRVVAEYSKDVLVISTQISDLLRSSDSL